jgi:hypothetical protein
LKNVNGPSLLGGIVLAALVGLFIFDWSQRVRAIRERQAAHPSGAVQVAEGRATKLEFKTQPATLAAGRQAIWLLKVLDAKTGKGVRLFQEQPGGLMQVTVASTDGAFSQQVVPEYKDYGSFVTTMTLPRPGRYRLLARYVPQEGVAEAVQHEFTVAGSSSGGD